MLLFNSEKLDNDKFDGVFFRKKISKQKGIPTENKLWKTRFPGEEGNYKKQRANAVSKGTPSLKFEKFSKKIFQHSDANNF